MYKQLLGYLCFLMLVISDLAYAYNITVTDDLGNKLVLPHPAHRIITIAPNLTEMAFAVGAGKYVIATDVKSNNPQRVKKLPKVASYNSLDIEKMLILKPDLILTVKDAALINYLQELKKLDPNLAIYTSNIQNVDAISHTLENIGKLAGTEKIAHTVANKFHQDFVKLKQRFSHNPKPVKVFYELWGSPLMTINAHSLINEAIITCGGTNIFSDTLAEASEVDIETVINKNPDIIVASRNDKTWKTKWQNWPKINAVKNHRLITLDPKLLESYTPRVLIGINNLCSKINRQ